MAHATMRHVTTKVHFHNHTKQNCLIQQASTEYPFTVSDIVPKERNKDFVVNEDLAAGTYDYQVRANDIRSITVPCSDKNEDIN